MGIVDTATDVPLGIFLGLTIGAILGKWTSVLRNESGAWRLARTISAIIVGAYVALLFFELAENLVWRWRIWRWEAGT